MAGGFAVGTVIKCMGNSVNLDEWTTTKNSTCCADVYSTAASLHCLEFRSSLV